MGVDTSSFEASPPVDAIGATVLKPGLLLLGSSTRKRSPPLLGMSSQLMRGTLVLHSSSGESRFSKIVAVSLCAACNWCTSLCSLAMICACASIVRVCSWRVRPHSWSFVSTSAPFSATFVPSAVAVPSVGSLSVRRGFESAQDRIFPTPPRGASAECAAPPPSPLASQRLFGCCLTFGRDGTPSLTAAPNLPAEAAARVVLATIARLGAQTPPPPPRAAARRVHSRPL